MTIVYSPLASQDAEHNARSYDVKSMQKKIRETARPHKVNRVIVRDNCIQKVAQIVSSSSVTKRALSLA